MLDSEARAFASGGRDPLSRMRAYRLATELLADAWNDAEGLRQNYVTEKVAAQLYSAIGSIAANL